MQFNCKCHYCRLNGYVWELPNNIIWVEIPKNASMNLKKFKFNFQSGIITDEPNALLKKVNNIDLVLHNRAFTILRNPIDRFKSLISHYFVEGRRVEHGKYWLSNYIGIQNYDINNIVDIVLDNWNKIHQIIEPHHFNSQFSFIPKQFFLMNHIVYDVSEVSFMFGLQRDVNTSKSSDIILNETQINKIKELYKEDVDLYQKYFKL